MFELVYGPPGAGKSQKHVQGSGDDRRSADLLVELDRAVASLGVVRQSVDACDADGVVAVLDRLTKLNGLVASLSARALARATAVGVARQAGAASMTAWLKDAHGVSGREAARSVRRAKFVKALAATDEALAKGRVSPDHVDTIIRHASDGTFGDTATAEQELLPAAERSGADDFARAARTEAARRDGARTARQAELAYRRRSVRFVHHRDGSISMLNRLHATAGTLLEQAVQAMTKPDPAGTPKELARTPDQRRADGLIDLVTAAVAAGAPPESGGVRPHLNVFVPIDRLVGDRALAAAASRPSEAPARSGLSIEGAVAKGESVRGGDGRSECAGLPGKDAAAEGESARRGDGPPEWAGLPSEGAVATGTRHRRDDARPSRSAAHSLPPAAELDGNGPLSTPELHRLLCDSSLTRLVTSGASQVLDVGRATRVWPVATRKAVAARDRGCRWPGCGRPVAWTDVHHVTWWERGGPTNVGNGVLLCSHHHHLVHDAGWTLDMDPDTAIVTVVSPTGAVRRTSHPPGFQPPTLLDLARRERTAVASVGVDRNGPARAGPG